MIRLLIILIAALISTVARGESAVYLSVPWTWAQTPPGEPRGPEPLPLGVTPALLDGGGRFFDVGGKEDSWWIGGYHGPRLQWDPIKLRAAFENLPVGLLYVVNIESWALDIRHHSPAEVEVTIDRLRRLIADIREINPTIKLGFYGYTPPREYWITTELSLASTARPVDFPRLLRAVQIHNRWVESATVNSRLLEGPGGFDVVMPSLYRFYPEQDKSYIPEHIRLATLIGHAKPVIPFFCPTFHNRGPINVAGTSIPEPEWRRDIRQALESGATAVIIWDGSRDWSVQALKPHIVWALDEAREVYKKESK